MHFTGLRKASSIRFVGFVAASAAFVGLCGNTVAAVPAPALGAPLRATGTQAVLGSTLTSLTDAARVAMAPAPVPAYEKQRLVWSVKNCSQEARDTATDVQVAGVRVECASYTAPVNWAKPAVGSLRIHLTRTPRVKASADTRPTRVLFVNPGGPGARADWFAPFVAASEPDVRKLFDVVAMDVRGSGRSTPLACPTQPDNVKDYGDLTDPAVVTAMQEAAKRTVSQCAKKYPYLLPYVTTANTLRDLDLARRLYGVKKADFYGVSAGTWLGARLAQQFPTVYDRVVLDSNVEFTATWRQSFGHQPRGFQERLTKQFVPWLARHHGTYQLGATTGEVMATMTGLRSGYATQMGRTPAGFDDILARHMYNDPQFVELANLLKQWKAAAAVRRPGQVRVPAPVGGNPLSPDEDGVFMAIPCNDSVWDTQPQSYVDEAKGYLNDKFTLIGATFGASWCATWPYKPSATPTPKGAVGGRLLMVQSQYDAATPLPGAKAAHAGNSSTRMVTVKGSGMHGVYMSGVPCIESVVTSYLTKGVYPTKDTECPGIPLPNERAMFDPDAAAAGGQRPTAAAQRRPAVPAAVQARLDQVRSRFFTRL